MYLRSAPIYIVNEKEGPVDAGVEGELVTEDKVRKSQITDGENQTRCQQSQSAGNQRSEQQLNKEGHKQKRKGAGMSKWVAGVRKIWGTRKKESCDDIAKGLVRAVGKMSSGFSVGKRVGQVNGKSGCWFIVRAPESCLLEVDKKWKYIYLTLVTCTCSLPTSDYSYMIVTRPLTRGIQQGRIFLWHIHSGHSWNPRIRINYACRFLQNECMQCCMNWSRAYIYMIVCVSTYMHMYMQPHSMRNKQLLYLGLTAWCSIMGRGFATCNKGSIQMLQGHIYSI